MKLRHPAMHPRWAAALRPMLVILPTLVLSACATRPLKVDAISRAVEEQPVSYRLQHRNPQVESDSLRHQEAVSYVKAALAGRGMYEAAEDEQADIIVHVDYGVGPPQLRIRTVKEPLYRELPGRIFTQQVRVGTDARGQPIFETVTKQMPTAVKLVGYREYKEAYVVYEKYLHVGARENTPAAEGRPAQQVWTVDVINEDESRDLRKTLPVLAATTIDYIGKDTQGQKTIRIRERNADVDYVKKGM